VHENDDWRVYHITSYEASVLYGKGTKWCISGADANGEKYFNDHASRLAIYFAIPKPPNPEELKTAVVVDANGNLQIFNAADDEIDELPEGLPDNWFEWIEPDIEPPEPEPEDYIEAQNAWLDIEGYSEFNSVASKVLTEYVVSELGSQVIGKSSLSIIDAGAEDYVKATIEALVESALYDLALDNGAEPDWRYEEQVNQYGGWDIQAWIDERDLARMAGRLDLNDVVEQANFSQEEINDLAWEHLYQPAFVDLVFDKFQGDKEATELWESVPEDQERAVFNRAMIAANAEVDETVFTWLPLWDINSATEAVTPELIQKVTIPGFEQSFLRNDAAQMRLFSQEPDGGQTGPFQVGEYVKINWSQSPESLSGWITGDARVGWGEIEYPVRVEQTGQEIYVPDSALSRPYQVVSYESFERIIQQAMLS